MKPAKPSPNFPLYPHCSGQWAKRIDGRVRYFGVWADPAGALAKYESYLQQQAAPKLGPTVLSIANAFLAAKRKAVERGELAQRSWSEYRDTCQRFADLIGKERAISSLGPPDFARFREERQKRWNLIAVGNEITRVRSLFKWAREARIIREIPHYGPDFRRPSTKAVRRHRRIQGKKLFTAAQIRSILDECGLQMRAMVLLGINCGFGNTDCATLPLSALDLPAAMIKYPRPKTEVDRDCPLWPETCAALAAWLERRPHSAASTVFTLPDSAWGSSTNPIAKRFRQILLWAGIKKGGFYWLRHTFETIAGGSKDQVAVNAIMGHADASMAAVYREEIEEWRLRAVADHVRSWIFGQPLA